MGQGFQLKLQDYRFPATPTVISLPQLQRIQSVYYNSLEFHADGTYATRALIYGSTVRGDGSYYPLVNGMFTYLKQGLNNASITLRVPQAAAARNPNINVYR